MGLVEDKQRLLELLQQGYCPDCGASTWQHIPLNPTMKIECLTCGASWMIELNVEAWWENGGTKTNNSNTDSKPEGIDTVVVDPYGGPERI